MKPLPLDEFIFSFSNSSGPGGQNVNKVNTKVLLRWDIYSTHFFSKEVLQRIKDNFPNNINQKGELFVQSDKFRSQDRNKQKCIAKIQDMLTQCWHPPKRRIKTKPKKSSIEKRIKNKKQKSETKQNRQKVRY